MRQVFQQELVEIQEGLIQLAQLVEQAIENAVEAFAQSDIALAEKVITHDSEVDALALDLDERVTNVLALQQPVASDLRLMVSALRMSASLERMADLAQHIAELARLRYPESAVPEPLVDIFTRMGQLDVLMAQKLLELLQTQDMNTIMEIRNLDDELDELHTRVFEKVLTGNLLQKPEHTVDATLASRYHERFGDHAVNISKQIHYLISGEHVSV